MTDTGFAAAAKCILATADGSEFTREHNEACDRFQEEMTPEERMAINMANNYVIFDLQQGKTHGPKAVTALMDRSVKYAVFLRAVFRQNYSVMEMKP